MKRVLILGGGGMLGHKLVRRWRERFDVWTTLRGDLERYDRFDLFDPARTFARVDVENLDRAVRIFGQVRPDVVVNCIGVVKQSPLARDPLTMLNINAVWPHRLAALCAASRARLITLSTDCVFSGQTGNYRETDFSDVADLYGRTKFLGEVAAENCLTVRTSIIGHELDTAHGLVNWFLSNQGKTVSGFTEAIFSGFPTVVLSDILAEIIEKYPNLSGVRHVSSDPIDKFRLLKMVREAYRVNIAIEASDRVKIDRSLNSDLFRRETGFVPLDWQTMIEQMAVDHQQTERR